MRSSTVLRGFALGVGLAMMPAAAFAVSVVSSDGQGEQHRTATYSNGAFADGVLLSIAGAPVYYAGRLDLNNCTDQNTDRYTGDVTRRTNQAAGGYITGFPGACNVQGVKSRICQNKNNLPDPCGADSAKF